MKKAKKNTTLTMCFIRIILLVALQVTAPVAFGGINFTVVDGGGSHSIGLKSDGTLWAWGDNTFGLLGNGTNTDTNTPVQIGTDTNWMAISGGFGHTIALKSDGTLWAWGRNDEGQLGDGSSTDRNTPVQIGTATNWTAISAGSQHTIALKSDGSLWAWGYNDDGQLGDGSSTDRNTPVQIGADTNWTAISAGGYHTIALKSDGTLWAWGYNNEGQLGNGTNTDTNTPARSLYVTPSAGSNGTIDPAVVQTIGHGQTTSFTVSPDTGYSASVDGTCGGALSGTTYTTSPVTGDCTVIASFIEDSLCIPIKTLAGTISVICL